MSSKTITMKRHSTDSLENLGTYVEGIVSKPYVDYNLISNKFEKKDDTEIVLVVLEKFFLRTSSMAALVVHCISYLGEQKMTIIGTGGGGGLFNVSWGANSNLVDEVASAMENIGFVEIDSEVI